MSGTCENKKPNKMGNVDLHFAGVLTRSKTSHDAETCRLVGRPHCPYSYVNLLCLQKVALVSCGGPILRQAHLADSKASWPSQFPAPGTPFLCALSARSRQGKLRLFVTVSWAVSVNEPLPAENIPLGKQARHSNGMRLISAHNLHGGRDRESL